jgi:cytochrome o ubiquinol oxidase subunit 2
VVALQWRWLFIYPAQGIATINYLELPSNTPVNFQLTADAPMNSFWIPQLGGQMYAMPGMSTQLHLEASNPGQFNGSAAEINGAGFAGMKFQVVAAASSDFDNWVAAVKNGPNHLDQAEYQRLARPSEDSAVAYYSAVPFDLYNSVIIKYMAPPAEEAL